MLTTDYMAGYVLIDVGHGDVQRVVERLLQHPNVHRAHALLGRTATDSDRDRLESGRKTAVTVTALPAWETMPALMYHSVSTVGGSSRRAIANPVGPMRGN